MHEFQAGDRVKINEKGRTEYLTRADGSDPLNFAGVVKRVRHDLCEHPIYVEWDNRLSNYYRSECLTKIGG